MSQGDLRLVARLRRESRPWILVDPRSVHVGPIHTSRLKRRIGAISQRSWPDIEAGLERVLGPSRVSA
ncbi:MAG: hypothetical protein E2P06_05215 [Acidobacteria bacterium]|nr:MAG: hypothetical protein E2P06_05215 [Acidobacteriota bacterium]